MEQSDVYIGETERRTTLFNERSRRTNPKNPKEQIRPREQT